MTLRTCFFENGLKYKDIKWPPKMRFLQGENIRIVVVGMDQCEENFSDDESWYQDQIKSWVSDILAPVAVAGDMATRTT